MDFSHFPWPSFVVMVFAVSAAYGAILSAPYVPTNRKLRAAAAAAFPLAPGAVLYDLGSGDGSVLFAFADRQPGLKAVGYEVSLFPYLIAQLRRLAGGRKYRNVRFRLRNFFKQDLSGADAVYFYLLPRIYPKMAAKFAADLKDGALVLAGTWPFDGMPAEKTADASGTCSVYAYRGAQFRK